MNSKAEQKKYFPYLILIIVTLIMIQSCSKTESSEIKSVPTKSDSIQYLVNKVVEDGEAPGVIAAIISSEGVIAKASAGVRKAFWGNEFTTNDVVHLGSCGKAMTATMIATLVAEGKLNWDTKLIEAIPELKGKIHADYHNITLWHLLTHRAGIPKNWRNYYEHNSEDIKKRRLSIVENNLNEPATYELDRFNYSNFGYVIVACMAEQLTGLSWEDLMKKRLFEPLGMSTAGFGNPNKDESTNQPWGHKKILWMWWPSEFYYEEEMGPAGRIHCSIADWAKFLLLQLLPQNPFLERKYLDKLIEPVGDYAGGWVVGEYPWVKGTTIFHNGSNEIWYAEVFVAPRIDRAFIIASNSCDFDSTPKVCHEIINKLIKMELNMENK